jgi:hypothetical protein
MIKRSSQRSEYYDCGNHSLRCYENVMSLVNIEFSLKLELFIGLISFAMLCFVLSIQGCLVIANIYIRSTSKNMMSEQADM